MTTGTVHDLADDLSLIEGHHPQSLWEDPDLPTIGVYRRGPRLYLLDTGVGPEQRDAIRKVAARHDGLQEVVLLNSHGHMDHLGNNDVVTELGVGTVRHYVPRDARAALDFAEFFRSMYARGLPYFDYLRGLHLDPDRVAALLRALGAGPQLGTDDVAALGARLDELGLAPAISPFVPSLVVDILLNTYPPVFPNIAQMVDYESLGPASEIRIGDTTWTGWTFTDEQGRPEVHALQSCGHAAGGLVFHIPDHRVLLLADETSSVPIWSDTVPANTIATVRRALSLMDSGHVTTVCAGHRPMLPAEGDQARQALQGVISSGEEFATTVDAAVARHPDGVTIDDLYDELVASADPRSTIALLVGLQFPVFSTFLKLTLLNHCLLSGFTEGVGANGRPTFRAG
ncbi:MBL fold metallo-hydrolase [Actinomycetospora lutea]|uniref:MBL fold metallo-hydrolase n=1 Tax=Actinomycetospora lutea TaxID=663604 RepID=UPI002367195F|nr:MBL fold metallo-hydrolase [Actinomycetospora lutea]MDD7938986.1 MBL fold metallo-hydrolase [Actinomycetospora lutea]